MSDLQPPPGKSATHLDELEFISTQQPSGPDRLVESMAKELPFLPQLLEAPTLDEKIAIVRRSVTPDGYEALLMKLIVVTYQLQQKQKRLKQALELIRLQHWLASNLPETWTAEKGMGHGRTRHLADAHKSLGSVRADLGELAQGLDHLRIAESLYLRAEQERNALGLPAASDYDRAFSQQGVLAPLLESMARVYQELGDDRNAAEYGARAARLQRQRATAQSQVAAWLGRGRAALHHGDHDGALRAFHEALDLAVADAGNQVSARDVVTACNHLGRTLTELGLHRQALRYLERALDLNRRAGQLERMSYDHLALGAVLEARSDLGDPLPHYIAALECASAPDHGGGPFTWRAMDGRRLHLVDPDLAWPAAMAVARVYREREDLEQAEGFLELAVEAAEALRWKVVDEEHRITVQANRMEGYLAMLSLLVERYRRAGSAGDRRPHARRAWRYAERARGRAFLDALGSTSLPPPPELPADLVQQERDLLALRRQAVEARVGAAPGERLAGWEAYERAEAELDRVWSAMAVRTPAADPYVTLRRALPADADDLLPHLESPAGEAARPARPACLISYFTLPDRFVVFGVGGELDGVEMAEIPIENGALHNLGTGSFGEHNQVRDLVEMGLEDLWHHECDRLIEPIARWTQPGTTVCLVPHGVLHYLPLHALRLGDEYLFERNPVCYAPSASVLKHCRVRRRDQPDIGKRDATGVLVMGDSRGDLPSAAAEAETVAGLFGTSPLLRKAVTRDGLAPKLPHAHLVHFAGHAYFDPEEPMRSGLMLADDGVLTAEEVFRQRLGAQLVTLSGCETGISENKPGDELLGLTRAFLYAGAPALLVSLWRVSDDSTAFLMRRFYSHLQAEPRPSRAEALRLAMLETRAEPGWSTLYHWAPFTLVGDWS
jgi:tetratricopeptide (TPR) repeat protein